VDSYWIGILNLDVGDVPDYVKRILVIAGGQEILDDLENYYRGMDDVKRVVLEDRLRPAYPQDDSAVSLGYSIVTAFLNPNLIYDATETARRIKQAVDSVPLAKGTVLAKERIVNNHERITKEILEKLQSLAQAKAEMEAREGGIKLILPYFGRAFFVALALSFTVLFIFVSRKANFNNVKHVFMIFLIMMVIIGFTFLVNQFGYSKYKYLIPISIASMLLTIFFDSRLAFIVTVTLSLIIGAMRGNEFDIMVISLFVGTISVFIVRQIQARAWILKGIIFISGAYIFSISAIEFLRNPDFLNGNDFLCGIANGALSPILTYGLMVIFEYLFKMTTDSTLLELSDLNRPLLRQLAIRAPGTYHHSIMVGNLAEAAAETIGANALRARVGSYYHDIGKMEMAEYFVENQKGGKNPHEKLAPNMSCLILINHVKRGLEIAEEYKLPREIRDFIPQHHGTNLIGFFYNKAIETQDGAEINEADFRYPGPRPQTKEAGIVMLADAVEASSRTLKDPTVSRIRSLVNRFIQERLSDGELDECPLTTRDLNLIRESFVNHLTGIFHGRIEYPGKKKKLFGTNGKKSAEKTVEASR
jgi:putative nucleotidyltransferase with HDIG domain